MEQYPDVLSGVTPYVSVNTSVRSGAEKFKRTQVYGVSEDFADMDAAFGEELAQGRYIKYLDVTRRSTVCVIGEYINQTAFGGDGLGKSIPDWRRTVHSSGDSLRWKLCPGRGRPQ